jgi:hypothetical protein
MAKTSLVPKSADAFKNHAINGAFDLWQRVGGNATAFAAATGGLYTADRFQTFTAGPTAKTVSIQRSTSVPSVSEAQFVAPYSFQATCSATTSFAAADRFFFWRYIIEDNDCSRLIGGSVTVAFWYFSNTAGSYPFRAYNYKTARSYVTSFSYTSANVWQRIVVVVPLEATAMSYTNGAGLGFSMNNEGSTTATATLNAWQAGDFGSPSSGVVNMLTNGWVGRVALVSIFEGDQTAMGNKQFARAGRTIQEELALCQRYYEKSYSRDVVPGTASSNPGYHECIVGTNTLGIGQEYGTVRYLIRKRVNATAAIYSYAGVLTRISTVNGIDIATNNSGTPTGQGEGGMTVYNSSGGALTTTGLGVIFHWTADCEF